MITPKPRQGYVYGLLIALILPILAACGGPSTGAPTSAPAAQATPAAQPTTAPAATAAPAAATTAPAATAAPAGEGKVLRIHQPSYPDVFDPQKSSFAAEIAVLQLNYEGLAKLDKDLQAVPAAAEKWTFNDKGDQLTFTLRDGLQYSDGSPLTAERFRYAVLRTCDPKTAGQYPSILYDIVGCQDWFENTLITDTVAYDAAKKKLEENVQATDDKTLVLTFNQPAPYFPFIATTWVLFPAKQELIEKAGADWWKTPENHVGNGPFKITQIEEEQIIKFEANPNYWEGKPKLDGMEFVYLKDAAIAIEAYKAGQLDTVQLSSAPDQIPVLKADPVLSKELLTNAAANTFGMGFNLTKEPFQDKKVREAFAYAFDRKTYCEVIRSGDCVPAYSWIPAGVAGALKTTAYDFDPEKAKQALAESSYGGPDKLPEIKLTFASSDPSNQPRAEWYAGQIRDILGINLVLEPVETKALSALRKNPETYPQVCFTCQNWFQDYPDPQNWLSVFWTCGGFAKRVSYCNAKLDETLKLADAELDPAKRTKLYEQANQMLLDDLPSPFMYHRANVFLVKPYVTGYTPTSADAEWPGERGSIMTIDSSR